MEKEIRIKKEISRLKKIYKELPPGKKKLSAGLIERAAYIKVSLEDLEVDLNENGFVALFTQSDRLDPYERERPAARLYANLVARYAAIHKQLTGLLSEKEGFPATDDFETF